MALNLAKTVNTTLNPDLTQADIDAAIANGQFAAGTTPADIFLGSDANAEIVTDSGDGEIQYASGGVVTSSSNLTFDGSTLAVPTVTSTAIATKTANYTATTSDSLIRGDATAGSITITLPTAVGNPGKTFYIKKIDSSANTVTIDGNGAETIDGAATKVLNTQYASYTIISNNAGWDIV